MELTEAMRTRHSVRSYEERGIEPEKAAALRDVIESVNRESGLHIQLQLDEPGGFSGMMAHYGSFDGVTNYIVLAGPKDRDRAVGYYGEKIVLEAQMLGLNTCWVALTYNKRKAVYDLDDGEKLYVVLSLGYGKTQGAAHKSKSPADVTDGWRDDLPEWYREGVKAALLAPTAVNQQKFRFALNGDRVIASPGNGFYTEMDLGIALYHFEIGSGRRVFGQEA